MASKTGPQSWQGRDAGKPRIGEADRAWRTSDATRRGPDWSRGLFVRIGLRPPHGRDTAALPRKLCHNQRRRLAVRRRRRAWADSVDSNMPKPEGDRPQDGKGRCGEPPYLRSAVPLLFAMSITAVACSSRQQRSKEEQAIAILSVRGTSEQQAGNVAAPFSLAGERWRRSREAGQHASHQKAEPSKDMSPSIPTLGR